MKKKIFLSVFSDVNFVKINLYCHFYDKTNQNALHVFDTIMLNANFNVLIPVIMASFRVSSM